MRKLIYLFIPMLIALVSCDPCADVNCLNGGACNEGACICPEGFSGTYCENIADPCDDVNCLNGGVCVDGTCDCPTGYIGEFCQTEHDPCANVVCQNGGICVDGLCICPDGYEGTNCETVSRDKFIGTYNVVEVCTSGYDTYSLTITQGMGIDGIVITNLYNAGFTIQGSVDGDSFNIAAQSFGTGTISGIGNMVGQTLTITYTISIGGQSDSCTATAQ